MNKVLDMPAGSQILEAINRLNSLTRVRAESKIVALSEEDSAKERLLLIEYIKAQLFDHAGHLMGCWLAVKQEYEPLCNSVSHILRRAEEVAAQRRAKDEKIKAELAAEAGSPS